MADLPSSDLFRFDVAPHPSWEAVVSHQLKTPLCAMLAEIDQTRPVDVGQVQKGIRRMLRLIDQLQVAGLCKAEHRIVLAPIQLAVLAQGICASLFPIARRQGKRIVLRDFSTRARAMADATLAQEALSNVIENALKYSPRDSQVTVVVTKRCKVFVLDEGQGIPAPSAEKIFSAFWRGQPHERDGSGLGLYLTQGIMLRHGGSVSHRNRARKGSAFILEFTPAPAGAGRRTAGSDTARPDRWR